MDAKTLCLGALTLGEASGYEIRKMFEEGPFSHFHDTNYGSIYPALGKLLDDEQVSCTEVPQDGKPDKKVYAITDKGLRDFRKALKKIPARDKVRSEAIFMMFFGDHMDNESLEDVYTQYLEQAHNAVAKLDSLDENCLSPQRLFVRGLGKVFYTSIKTYMEENRHLLLGDAEKRIVNDNNTENDKDNGS